MKKFIEELKRRNVIKASIAYLVIAWVLLQVLSLLLPMVDAPEWLLPTLTLIMAIGLPIWIIISWVYDITPEGIEKTAKVSENDLVTEMTNKRLNIFIIVSLSIAVIVLGLKLTNSSSDSDERYAIAVLPFDNMNVDEDNVWISKGLTIDIHTYLSKIKNLTIISERAVREALDSEKTLPEIAELLNVTHFVGGSVRQFNNDIKISVHLTEVSNDKDPWAENYNRNLNNPFKVQQDVSQKIVAQLEVELTPEEEKTLQKFPTENTEAYELFAKGREFASLRGKENLGKSIELFKQAVDLDPNYAEAYAEIAHSYLLINPVIGETEEEWLNKMNLYLDKALKLDPNVFRAHSTKAMIAQQYNKWDKAGKYFEKAIAINSNDASVHMQYGLNLIWRPDRDLNKSLNHFKIAQKLEPFTRLKNIHLFRAFLRSGKIEEAEEHINKYGFLFSKGTQLDYKSFIKAYKNKDWTEAIRFFESELEKDPNNTLLYDRLGHAYDEILNDDKNFIKYAKKAYEQDSTNSNYAFTYFGSLVEGKKFAAAKKLMQSNNFRSSVVEKEKLECLWRYYYHQENYRKAQDVLKESLITHFYTQQLFTYAQLGDIKTIDSVFKEYSYSDFHKAVVYAILKERDSMYHYLDKMDEIKVKYVNSGRELDPYRKEERYKTLLKKNYLPITHWNE